MYLYAESSSPANYMIVVFLTTQYPTWQILLLLLSLYIASYSTNSRANTTKTAAGEISTQYLDVLPSVCICIMFLSMSCFHRTRLRPCTIFSSCFPAQTKRPRASTWPVCQVWDLWLSPAPVSTANNGHFMPNNADQVIYQVENDEGGPWANCEDAEQDLVENRR